MIKAVIFDMDGTLLNSEELWFSSARAILKKYGAELSEKEYCSWVGRDETLMLYKKAKQAEYSFDSKTLSDERVELVLKLLFDYPLKADENLMNFIPSFEEKYLRIGIATGTRRIVTTAFLKKLKIEEKFECIITSTDVKKKKPDKETYVLCAKCLAVEPKECLVFEDSQAGIESAKSAGMACIAVPTKFSTGQDFSKADLVIKDRKKINADILRRWIE